VEQILNFIEFNQYNLPAILELIALYIAIIWLAVVAWTIRDITTRSNNFLVILLSFLLVLVGNVPGLVIYILVRPQQTIEDGRNKELFYASILDKEISSCKSCGMLVRSDYKHCPNCAQDLRDECPNCSEQINPIWTYCVNCNYRLSPQPFLIRLSNATRNRANSLGQAAINLFRRGSKINSDKKKVDEDADKDKPKGKSEAKPNWLIQKLPKFKFVFQVPNWLNINSTSTANKQVKVVAEKKHVMERKAKVEEPKKSKTKSSSKPKKKRRGRPKGSTDSKPRKKRSDAGKKRGSYKT
jgi:hypothetical protein